MTANDDKIFIYFKSAVDTSTLNTNVNDDFEITGNGEIGSFSTGTYNSNLNLYTISLNSNGTSSVSFTVNSDTIKIKDNAIKLVGSSVFLTDQSNKIVLPIKRVLRTNQNNSYYSGDDGYYKAGYSRSVTRDSTTEIITDNNTNLMWIDNSESANSKSYSQAHDFCSNLNAIPVKYFQHKNNRKPINSFPVQAFPLDLI